MKNALLNNSLLKNSALKNLKVVGDYRAELGETPVWCLNSQSLIWVDIVQRRLLRYWPDQDDRFEIHSLPSVCSAVLLTDRSEHFLLITGEGILLYDYHSMTHYPLCGWPETAATRPNEAAIAPDGSVWFSTMDVTARSALGSWYRYATGDAQPVKMLGDQHVPNTLVWHGGHAWFIDTFAHCFCQSPASLITHPTLRTWPLPDDVFADGSAVTHTGLLLNARWGAACLAAYQLNDYAPQLLTTFPLPVMQPSSCAFGGSHFQDLYITSARDGLSCPSATDGALLRYETPYTGQRASLFTL